MPFAPLAIANTFLARYGVESGGISHMKLQKLVFYAYGWWLASYDEPLASEAPQVWQYGPVFSSLYSALAPFGMEPIDSPMRAVPIGSAPIVPESDVEVHELLEWVWQRYGGYGAGKLSDMTHAKGTPWQEEAEAHNYRVPRNHTIPDARTKAYFESLAARLNGSAA
jgi:uncharacterized phage-associated protein